MDSYILVYRSPWTDGRTDGGHDEPVPGQLPGVVGYIEDGDGGRHWPAVSSMLV